MCDVLQVLADVDADAVARGVVGITFKTGVVSAVLPLTPEDYDLLPPPYELRVLQQPQKRARRRALTNFKILTLKSAPVPPAGSESAPVDGAVPALKLEAAASAASALTSNPNSRPVSSRDNGAAAAASEPAATPAAPAAPAAASGKATPRGKSSHGPGAAKNSKAPAVLEDAGQEAVVPDT